MTHALHELHWAVYLTHSLNNNTHLQKHPTTWVHLLLQVKPTVQNTDSSFEAMAAGTKRKYFMISGKGGVGKTSLAASLACKFAAAGHTTLVVSTDPAHSLSDSLDQVAGSLVCYNDLALAPTCT